MSEVTIRDEDLSVLDDLPEDRVEAALEAVEGRGTSIDAILARYGERRLDPQEFECQFGSLPTDDEG